MTPFRGVTILRGVTPFRGVTPLPGECAAEPFVRGGQQECVAVGREGPCAGGQRADAAGRGDVRDEGEVDHHGAAAGRGAHGCAECRVVGVRHTAFRAHRPQAVSVRQPHDFCPCGAGAAPVAPIGCPSFSPGTFAV